jgi:probable rRNA maturation factor
MNTPVAANPVAAPGLGRYGRAMGYDLIIEAGDWDEAALEALAARAWSALADHLDWAEDSYEVALLACDDARIAQLNADFRQKSAATNVLSWPAAEFDAPDTAPQDPELGDIAIAHETCAREAKSQNKRFEDHVSHLLVHGTLHLLGFDHETEQEAALMEGIEVEILAKMGIADPYRGAG